MQGPYENTGAWSLEGSIRPVLVRITRLILQKAAFFYLTLEIFGGKGGQSSSTMWYRADIAIRSAYGGLPVKSSTIVHARDQISDFGQAPFISITSGAIQLGVPAGVPLPSSCFILRFKDTPKSVSLISPVFVVRIFAAFRSQWTTSWLWRYSNPFKIL